MSRPRLLGFVPTRNASSFTFSRENFRRPRLPEGLDVVDVPLVEATASSLAGYGRLLASADDACVEKGTFEITPWPTLGWRRLDPETGDEAGTTEGDFEVFWSGDHFFGHNLAVATANNFYLDGLGVPPERARDAEPATGDGRLMHLWMSDHHPSEERALNSRAARPAQP